MQSTASTSSSVTQSTGRCDQFSPGRSDRARLPPPAVLNTRETTSASRARDAREARAPCEESSGMFTSQSASQMIRNSSVSMPRALWWFAMIPQTWPTAAESTSSLSRIPRAIGGPSTSSHRPAAEPCLLRTSQRPPAGTVGLREICFLDQKRFLTPTPAQPPPRPPAAESPRPASLPAVAAPKGPQTREGQGNPGRRRRCPGRAGAWIL